jgi:DNA-binding IclR family transcriptional regulator
MSGDISLTVQKAIHLLSEIGGGSSGIRLADLVQRSGLSKTVCFRLLTTLESEGMVMRDESSGGYVLGLKFIELAGRSLSRNTLRSQAAPIMDELARRTGDSVLLFIPSKLKAMCIERRDGDAPVRPQGADIGGCLEFNTGGAPLVILSYLPDDEREAFLAQELQKTTSRSIVDPDEIRKRIARVRRVGYAIGDEDAIEHVVAVGAPLFGHEQRLLGGLSIGGIKARYTPKRIREITEIVCEAADRISSKLGGSGSRAK